ncbi:hypothetical protein AAHA92_17012 [Salvia divinorum]|uniref:Uncharacterized protein n=1 Tax=Salvia divinorum TaxID=28513 RepID=A0ABD1H0L0_SALDI
MLIDYIHKHRRCTLRNTASVTVISSGSRPLTVCNCRSRCTGGDLLVVVQVRQRFSNSCNLCICSDVGVFPLSASVAAAVILSVPLASSRSSLPCPVASPVRISAGGWYLIK